MAILDKIQFPKDLRKLSKEDLPLVAEEIRELLLQTVSTYGGHLASNLGSVELTLALHYVFQTPDDKLIWDVGHQSYPHKILTGRKELFHTIRQKEGLSGFTSRAESLYDCFGAGHASTSISAALGIAEALRHSGSQNLAIAVIGDGSLTGGLAFEALNNAGHIPAKNLVVVLNDNEMSIDPNVGALSKSIHPNYQTFFGCFGFKYFGPIDGHDLPKLLNTFQSIAQEAPAQGPYFIHALTRKGKGYALAEGHPLKYHGVTPFKVEVGIASSGNKKANYQDVFADTLIKIAKEDPKVIAITAAMPSGTGLAKFQEVLPERCYDVGIAEAHAVLFAAGFATEGYKPVAAIYSTFLQRAYDQIIHDVALQKLPVIFAMDRAGVVGADGATHQGAFDLTYLRPIPGMVIMAPKDENELQHMLYTAIQYKDGPVALRYPRGEVVGVPLDTTLKKIPIGKAEVLLATDDCPDVLLIGIGYSVQPCLEAAKHLLDKKLGVAVINGRFAKPLDEELLLKWIERSMLVVVVEENSILGGFGSAISELLTDHRLQTELVRLAITDEFIEHATQKEQRADLKLDAQGILNAITEKIIHMQPNEALALGSNLEHTLR